MKTLVLFIIGVVAWKLISHDPETVLKFLILSGVICYLWFAKSASAGATRRPITDSGKVHVPVKRKTALWQSSKYSLAYPSAPEPDLMQQAMWEASHDYDRRYMNYVATGYYQ